MSAMQIAGLYANGLAAYEVYEDEIVAIGECGIDLHYDDADATLETQQSVLHDHCRLALEL
jgi:Tat protein secretion system quality control protein TatD with DNase activity